MAILASAAPESNNFPAPNISLVQLPTKPTNDTTIINGPVWLFGSGLIGLASISRRKTA